MKSRDWNQIFEEFSPTSQQEQAMLEEVLREPRKKSPMKPMKKTAVVLAAAALLLLACAFTVAVGLDGRFLAYFGAGEEDAPLVSGGVAEVDHSFRYSDGWTITVEQVLADRYSLAVLTEVIAPQGTVLDGESYFLELGVELPPAVQIRPAASGWGYGPVILEDEDPADNRLTFLTTKGVGELGAETLLGQRVTLTPIWLQESGGRKLSVDFSGEEQSCTVELPQQDGGRTYALNDAIQVDGEEWTLKELYLSPISLAFTLERENAETQKWELSEMTSMEEEAVLHLAKGEAVTLRRVVSQTQDQETGAVRCVFQTDQVLKLEDVTSITILGQTFSLVELTAAEG